MAAANGFVRRIKRAQQLKLNLRQRPAAHHVVNPADGQPRRLRIGKIRVALLADGGRVLVGRGSASDKSRRQGTVAISLSPNPGIGARSTDVGGAEEREDALWPGAIEDLRCR